MLFIAAPTVTAITPPTVLANAPANVTIAGLGFALGATVTVGGTPATNVTVVTTRITATVPAHAVDVADVVITNPGPASGTLHDLVYVTINPLPGPQGQNLGIPAPRPPRSPWAQSSR